LRLIQERGGGTMDAANRAIVDDCLIVSGDGGRDTPRPVVGWVGRLDQQSRKALRKMSSYIFVLRNGDNSDAPTMNVS
jgi:hypothetical protein